MLTSDEAYRGLREVSLARGNSKKVELKKLGVGIQPYLQAAYNPYRRYYLKTAVAGFGTQMFDDDTWLILDGLSKRTISGGEARNIVSDHVSQLTPKSASVFNAILGKDLRIGMGAKTINKVFPNLIPSHDVMLAKKFEMSRVKFPCFGSPKIDGVRAIYKFGEFYSRGGHKYVGLEHLKEELQGVESHIDGELDVPGYTFQEASGMLRSDNRTPEAAFNMLDLPWVKSPFTVRLTRLDDLAMTGDHLFAVPHITLHNATELHDFYKGCRKMNYEGSVIKPGDYKYVGTRSYDWMKMKDILDVDLEVIDVFEGTGKYTGQLGGAIVSYNGQYVRVGSGFSDQERMDYWTWPEVSPLVGQCIEIHYMEETDGGSLRHPRFICIRHDKS